MADLLKQAAFERRRVRNTWLALRAVPIWQRRHAATSFWLGPNSYNPVVAVACEGYSLVPMIPVTTRLTRDGTESY